VLQSLFVVLPSDFQSDYANLHTNRSHAVSSHRMLICIRPTSNWIEFSWWLSILECHSSMTHCHICVYCMCVGLFTSQLTILSKAITSAIRLRHHEFTMRIVWGYHWLRFSYDCQDHSRRTKIVVACDFHSTHIAIASFILVYDHGLIAPRIILKRITTVGRTSL